MKALMLSMLACVALAGCGLGETAATAAAGGASEAEQAKQALAAQARVNRELDAAQKLEAERRQSADSTDK